MKAKILTSKFRRQWTSDKYNKTYYDFDISYEVDGVTKDGQFTSTNQNQDVFKPGIEIDIVEEQREFQGNVYFKIKPSKEAFTGSQYSRKLKQNQAHYSSFAVAYCKDLIIADKLDIKDWEKASKKICKFMFDLDNELMQ